MCTGPFTDRCWKDHWGLDRPRASGKVLYVGSSSFAANAIVEAQVVSRHRHLWRFVTEQPLNSMIVRRVKSDVFPTIQHKARGPSRTAAIIGLRAMRSSSRRCGRRTSRSATMSWSDEIFAPGLTLNQDYYSYGTTELAVAPRRR